MVFALPNPPPYIFPYSLLYSINEMPIMKQFVYLNNLLKKKKCPNPSSWVFRGIRLLLFTTKNYKTLLSHFYPLRTYPAAFLGSQILSISEEAGKHNNLHLQN